MSATEPAERIRERGEEARQTVQDAARELQDQVEPMLQQVDETVHRLVDEHPLATLAGAVAAGYLLGRVLSRR